MPSFSTFFNTFEVKINGLYMSQYPKSVIFHKYKSALADFLGLSPAHLTLYWKGRVGLYAILQALDIGPGDEVLLPGFTCVVVPNAILYRGAQPIYLDIDPRSLNLNPTQIEPHISPRTKAILVQNTFGLSPDFAAIRQLADRHQLKIIEDNTHGFGSRYRGQASGLLGDAAFFSSQWNKPFSTGIGGFVVAHEPELRQALHRIEASLPPPSSRADWMLRRQLQLRQLLGHSTFYWPALRLYRWLSQNNLISGSSEGGELAGPQMPEGFLRGAAPIQAEEGLRQLARFPDNIRHRRRLADRYQAAFREWGFPPIYEPEYADHLFLKYAFFVRDRPAFLDLAARHRIPLGDWFLSPIHPIPSHWERWQYRTGSCPIAEKLSRHILNLPTDPSVSLAEAERIIAFLADHRSTLLAPEEYAPLHP